MNAIDIALITISASFGLFVCICAVSAFSDELIQIIRAWRERP